MLPTLRPGDRLLLSYRRAPRPGAIVVARLPGGVLATKRAVELLRTLLHPPALPDQVPSARDVES